jgi:hypothetical protein
MQFVRSAAFLKIEKQFQHVLGKRGGLATGRGPLSPRQKKSM